ncbi:MAG: hypothetical protein V4702_01150 [Patescibacteria group bacterium]
MTDFNTLPVAIHLGDVQVRRGIANRLCREGGIVRITPPLGGPLGMDVEFLPDSERRTPNKSHGNLTILDDLTGDPENWGAGSVEAVPESKGVLGFGGVVKLVFSLEPLPDGMVSDSMAFE